MAYYIDDQGQYQELPKSDMYNNMSLFTGLNPPDIVADSGKEKTVEENRASLYREQNDLESPESLNNDNQAEVHNIRRTRQQRILTRLRQKLKNREGYNEVSIQKRRVQNFMQKPKAIAFENIKIVEAWALFKEHQIHFIPIVNKNEEYQGIISDRGLLFYLLENADEKALDGGIESFLMDNISVLEPDSDLKDAALTAINSYIGVIPVLDPKKHVTGLVDPVDILRTLFIDRRPLNVVK